MKTLTLTTLAFAATLSFGAAPLRAENSEAAFVKKAADGNMAEVQLGQLARKKGQSAAVKQFGMHMVNDHSKTVAELKSLAAAKKIALPARPSAEHRAEAAKLAKMSSPDFDHAYVAAMVKDHREDVADFRHESKAAKDAEVKAFATKTLPVLQSHLAMIERISAEQGKAGGAAGHESKKSGGLFGFLGRS